MKISKEDKTTFLYSFISGLLGAVAYIIGLEVKNAQEEDKRSMEDAVTRFESTKEHEHTDDGGDTEG
jgi:uncharacterized protein (DUF2164 family)